MEKAAFLAFEINSTESSNFLQKSGALLIFSGVYLRVLPPVKKGVKFYALLGLTDWSQRYIGIIQALFHTVFGCFPSAFKTYTAQDLDRLKTSLDTGIQDLLRGDFADKCLSCCQRQ